MLKFLKLALETFHMQWRMKLFLTLGLAPACRSITPAESDTTLLSANEGAAVFADTEVLAIDLSAPLAELFASNQDDPPWMPGTFTDTQGTEVAAQLRLRGHLSLESCRFPKLKIKFKEDAAPAAFGTTRKIKLLTHCDPKPEDALSLAGEVGVYREWLAYRLADTLGLKTHGVRRAMINYHDTALTGGVEAQTKPAALLEDPDDLAARYQATEIEPTAADIASLDSTAVAEIALFEALIGNPDWNVAAANAGHIAEIRNVEVFKTGSGQMILVANDFNIATFVNGNDRPWIETINGTDRLLPGQVPLARRAAYWLQRQRARFSRAVLEQALGRFNAHRADLYATVANAGIDEPSVDLAKAHLDAFFTAAAPQILFGPPLFVGERKLFLKVSGDETCIGVPNGTPVDVIEDGAIRKLVAPLLQGDDGPFCIDKLGAAHEVFWVDADALATSL